MKQGTSVIFVFLQPIRFIPHSNTNLTITIITFRLYNVPSDNANLGSEKVGHQATTVANIEVKCTSNVADVMAICLLVHRNISTQQSDVEAALTEVNGVVPLQGQLR